MLSSEHVTEGKEALDVKIWWLVCCANTISTLRIPQMDVPWRDTKLKLSSLQVLSCGPAWLSTVVRADKM